MAHVRYPKMFSINSIFRQQEKLVDNQKCLSGWIQATTYVTKYYSWNYTWYSLLSTSTKLVRGVFIFLNSQLCNIKANLKQEIYIQKVSD